MRDTEPFVHSDLAGLPSSPGSDVPWPSERSPIDPLGTTIAGAPASRTIRPGVSSSFPPCATMLALPTSPLGDYLASLPTFEPAALATTLLSAGADEMSVPAIDTVRGRVVTIPPPAPPALDVVSATAVLRLHQEGETEPCPMSTGETEPCPSSLGETDVDAVEPIARPRIVESLEGELNVEDEFLRTSHLFSPWTGNLGNLGNLGHLGKEKASGTSSPRIPAAVTLPPHARMDVTFADVPVSILPSIHVHADRADIVSDGQPRYTHVKPLGEGGVGTVDLVYDKDISRSVALKRLKGTSRTPVNLARFIEEIQAVGALQHPGIAPIHDVGIDEQGYFFTMKFVEGETLEKIISQLRSKSPAHDERFSTDARVSIFMQILRTVQFAHSSGYIHRDLKPANVIVGPFGEVLVMDWGLAKRVSREDSDGLSEDPSTSLQAEMAFRSAVEGEAPRGRAFETRTGALLGSPGYMSPEQALGLNDRLDERSDIYSLCVLFFEMLSLRHYLGHHKSVDAMVRAISTEEPVSAVAMHHRYGIPPEYTFFLRKGLEKDPSRRFQSVQQMISALQKIVDGKMPVQCPCTGLKRMGNAYGSFLDRHPIGGVTTAVLMGGLTLLGAAQLVMSALHVL